MTYLETAAEIAREAGALLATYFERRVGFELKGEYDLVTEADRASEALVVERLRSHFPGHAIVAEEGGGHESSSEYRWYVDPLDGTTNFAHGFPIFNVTLGLERAGEPIAGVVYDPIRREMFTAERGGGAYLNNHRIHVSATTRLDYSLLATGFPSRKRGGHPNIHFYHQLAMATHGVRRTGSAAIDLAYVACGRLDGFWEFGLNPWDMAGGLPDGGRGGRALYGHEGRAAHAAVAAPGGRQRRHPRPTARDFRRDIRRASAVRAAVRRRKLLLTPRLRQEAPPTREATTCTAAGAPAIPAARMSISSRGSVPRGSVRRILWSGEVSGFADHLLGRFVRHPGNTLQTYDHTTARPGGKQSDGGVIRWLFVG